jgi:hypothetical protein
LRIGKNAVFKSVFISLLVFILYNPEVYSETVGEDPYTGEEINFLEETGEQPSQYITQTNTIYPTYINPPYYYPIPFYFPWVVGYPFFFNQFFFSFGFSYYNPFFFSFGFPFFYNCPFLFSPFAYNPNFFYPPYNRYRYSNKFVGGKPSKGFQTRVPTNKPIMNPINRPGSRENNLQSQIPPKNSFGTILNPSNRYTTASRVTNNRTGLRLFGTQSNIPSKNYGSDTIPLENRFNSYHPAKIGYEPKNFRGNSSTGRNNNSANYMRSNSAFKNRYPSGVGISNYRFKGNSSGPTGRNSFGRMGGGGSFKGFRGK